jgi:hypothetical protein
MEGYSNPTVLNGSAGNSAPVVGGRRHKLKKVSAKTIRRTLKKMGMKPKGRVVLRGGEGLETPESPSSPAMGGKRRTRRRSASHPGGLMKMLGLSKRR